MAEEQPSESAEGAQTLKVSPESESMKRVGEIDRGFDCTQSCLKQYEDVRSKFEEILTEQEMATLKITSPPVIAVDVNPRPIVGTYIVSFERGGKRIEFSQSWGFAGGPGPYPPAGLSDEEIQEYRRNLESRAEHEALQRILERIRNNEEGEAAPVVLPPPEGGEPDPGGSGPVSGEKPKTGQPEQDGEKNNSSLLEEVPEEIAEHARRLVSHLNTDPRYKSPSLRGKWTTGQEAPLVRADDEAGSLGRALQEIQVPSERDRLFSRLNTYVSERTKYRLVRDESGYIDFQEKEEADTEDIREEQEKQRSIITEILAFLVQLVSQLRYGTGIDVTKYAENRSSRRQLRIIEGRMEAIAAAIVSNNAQIARRDLPPRDRQELLKQNETLEKEYQKLEKQLREQEKQKMRRAAGPSEEEEGADVPAEGAGRAGRERRHPEIAPRSEAQRELMQYIVRIERGEEVNLDEFRTVFTRVVAESSPEKRRRGLREMAQGLNGLQVAMHEHFDEFFHNLPQGVRERFSSSPEEAREEAILSFKEAWSQVIAIVNSVFEEVGEDARLVIDANGVVSVRGGESTGGGESPRTRRVPTQERASAGGPSGGSVEQHVTVNVGAESPQEPPAPAAREAPEYRLEDLDTNALRSYLSSIGYLGDFSVQGEYLVFSGVRGGAETEIVRSFLKGFPEKKGISRRIVETAVGASRTFEARVKLTSEALKHICGLSPSEGRRAPLKRPPGDYVEHIPATEFHKNGLVPVTIPAVIMQKIGMGERQHVLLIKQVSQGQFEVPRYLGDARELPSFSPERWSREPSADQIIAERLGLEIRNTSAGVAIIIPEKWVWSSAEGFYDDGPPMVVNGAKVVDTDLRNSPYYFG